MKRKNKATSALGVIVSIILIIVAAATLFTTVLFAKQDTPKLFGYYLYLQKSTAMEVADSADDTASIHANTVVFAKEYNGTDPLSVNNAILCVLSPDDPSPIEDKDSNGYAVRRILRIEPNDETGELLYYPTTMQTDRAGTEPAITGSSVLGLCQFEHAGLYSYVTFVQTLPGILLLLALPCILLIAMLIAKLVRARNNRLDENAYAFEESYDEVPGEDSYDEDYIDDADDSDYSDDGYQEQTPLYAPEISNTSTLDRKRVSIAQNFTPKAVNPNSPYQKARTMQFKAQKDIPILTSPYSQAPVQNNNYVGKYSAEPVQNYNEEPDSYVQETPQVQEYQQPQQEYQQVQEPVSQPVVQHAAVQQPYRGAHEADGTSGRVFRSNSSITSKFKKPNVDDILSGDPLARASSSSKSSPVAEKKKTPAESMKATSAKRGKKDNGSSVDDLLAMIADQKSKL
jgi:hypothetical protein